MPTLACYWHFFGMLFPSEWVQKFKNGELDIEDKERSGRLKVYEDADLEALLDQDSCETQEAQYDGQYFE